MGIIILVIIMLVLGYILKSPKFLGWIGEQGVSSRLDQLDQTVYKIIHDITIPSASNRTTQIDHIIIYAKEPLKYNEKYTVTVSYKGTIAELENKDYSVTHCLSPRRKIRWKYGRESGRKS